MLSIFWLAVTYLIGALPFGLVIAKVFCGVDPRGEGSRNTGATNVARLCGTPYGVMTLTLDLLKGFLPVWMAASFSDSSLFLGLAALAAVSGHMYSVFLGGRGGKGVATTIGVYLALTPGSLVLAVLLCIGVIAASGFVSLGSLTLAALMPILYFFTGQWGFIPLGVVLAFLIFWKHRENILRLARGEEKPWRKSKV